MAFAVGMLELNAAWAAVAFPYERRLKRQPSGGKNSMSRRDILPSYVELDFETYSLCDLKQCGAERYAEDISTEIICLSYGEGLIWHPYCLSAGLIYDYVGDPDTIFVAHNAAFEQAIWRHHMVKRYGFPELTIERWDCTMAASAWKGIPLALDKGARAFRLSATKDKEGNKLTLSMSKLDKKTGEFPLLTPVVRQRIIQYCAQDVEVERQLEKRVGLISRENRNERQIWELDQKINQRGVRLDMNFVNAAQKIIQKASAPLMEEFISLTGVSKIGSLKLKDWLAANGVPVENLQKGTIANLLKEPDDDSEEDNNLVSISSDNVRRVLGIRQMLGSAAVKKLKRMQACVGYDGRARGLLQYHAAHSGRWGGRLLQPQNFPRDNLGKIDPEHAVRTILSCDPAVVEKELGYPAIECVARSLRHALVPDDGKVFVVGDYAQIEARIILALAGQHDKTELMAQGQNPYLDFGFMMFGKPISKDNLAEYIPSKSGVLGCGFQCGPDNFNIKFLGGKELAIAEQVVETYRKKWAPKVPNVWYRQQEASLKAVETATEQESYGVVWRPEGDWLTASLPSKWQKLWYPFPHLGTGKFGDPCWKFRKPKGNDFVPVDMYGGLETENIVQALARGLLCGALIRVENAGMPVVLTVHDEIVAEVDEDRVDETKFASMMTQSPTWAEDMGIPIAVETWTGKRYRK